MGRRAKAYGCLGPLASDTTDMPDKMVFGSDCTGKKEAARMFTAGKAALLSYSLHNAANYETARRRGIPGAITLIAEITAPQTG